MAYALVVNNAVQSEGVLPSSARRLDTQQWVLGLPDATVALQQACGYYAVTNVARPVDDAVTTYDRSIVIVGGVPVETWTARPKTAAELAVDTTSTNSTAITTNLTADMAAVQAIINDTNANINANPAAAIKTMARMLRRLGRRALNDYTGTT